MGDNFDNGNYLPDSGEDDKGDLIEEETIYGVIDLEEDEEEEDDSGD